jgi:hypothetical protein
MDVSGADFGLSFSPNEFIMFVSPALVTIENFALHDGQAKKTPSEPSSGFSTFSRLIYVSQFKQTNFIKTPLAVAPQVLDERLRYHMDFQGVKPPEGADGEAQPKFMCHSPMGKRMAQKGSGNGAVKTTLDLDPSAVCVWMEF